MKRGEIYVVDLGPGIGYEASGVRPVVIVSNDVNNVSPLIVLVVPAVPVSDFLAPTGIRAAAADTGYSEDLAVLSRQPRALDASRFSGPPLGTIPAAVMALVDVKLAVEFDLEA